MMERFGSLPWGDLIAAVARAHHAINDIS